MSSYLSIKYNINSKVKLLLFILFVITITGAGNSKFPKLTGMTIAQDSLSKKLNNSNLNILKEVILDDSYYFYKEGLATYYGKQFHGRKTASGEKFDKYDFSAAHKTLPFGTIIRVRNLQNDKSIFVRINDRGPFSKKRIIDLSSMAASKLEIDGVSKVEIDGFKKNYESQEANKEIFYGYSYINDLIAVNKNQFTIINKTDDFGYAVELYNNLIEKDNIYLFVESNITSKKSINADKYYYIGKIIAKIGNGKTYNLTQFNKI